MAIATDGTLWCSTNERDDLGNDLPPDYVTRVREGSFFGWPCITSAAMKIRITAASAPTSKTR